MNLTIDPEFKSLIPALTSEERAQLEANLINEGCRDALVVWRAGDTLILVDGHNRHEICTTRGIEFKTVEREFETREDVIAWIVDNQLGRRNLITYVRAVLALKKEEAIAAKAKDRMLAGKLLDPVENSPQGKTRDIVAELADTSENTVRKVKNIVNNAPEQIRKATESGDLSINKANEITKALQGAHERVASVVASYVLDDLDTLEIVKHLHKTSADSFNEIEVTGYIQPGDEHEAVHITAGAKKVQEAIDLKAKIHKQLAGQVRHEERNSRINQEPNGVYSVLYADPAWQYSNSGTDNSAASRYATMPTADICSLLKDNKIQVADLAVLFLWATNPLLPDALQVIKAWGFEYKTNAVWVKNRNAGGFYLLGQHELLLIAVRGDNWHPTSHYTSVIQAPMTRHSEKPLLHAQIETMYPFQRYIELFARTVEPREHWTYWGDQVEHAA